MKTENRVRYSFTTVKDRYDLNTEALRTTPAGYVAAVRLLAGPFFDGAARRRVSKEVPDSDIQAAIESLQGLLAPAGTAAAPRTKASFRADPLSDYHDLIRADEAFRRYSEKVGGVSRARFYRSLDRRQPNLPGWSYPIPTVRDGRYRYLTKVVLDRMIAAATAARGEVRTLANDPEAPEKSAWARKFVPKRRYFARPDQ